MVKKNKRIGDRESYLEHHAALLPLRFTFVPFGTGHAGSDVIGSPERSVLMQYVDDDATQKRFYETLLKLPWLAPKVRNAIMRELGGSQREEDVRIEKARTWTLRHEVSEVEARLGEWSAIEGRLHQDAAQRLADSGKQVIIAGLDTDYLGRPFPPIPDLLALAGVVVGRKSGPRLTCTLSKTPVVSTVGGVCA